MVDCAGKLVLTSWLANKQAGRQAILWFYSRSPYIALPKRVKRRATLLPYSS